MKKNLIVAISPVVLGGLIYLTYRVEKLQMFTWSEKTGTSSIVYFLRTTKILQSIQLPAWVKFSLPDALWAFSFTYAMLLIWQFKITKINAFWVFIAPLTGIASELGQYWGYLPGTYDQVDLLLLLIATFIPFLMGKIFSSKSIPNYEIGHYS
jgi:hypothetical protein